MQGELFIIHCPRCGRQEGYAPTEEDRIEPAVGDEDAIADEQEFFTRDGHIVHKLRCPRCNDWVEASRATPAE